MITIIKPQEKSPVLKFNESNLAHNKMSITDTVFDVMVEQQKKLIITIDKEKKLTNINVFSVAFFAVII
ncbi:TPA: hypothetical protein IWM38_002782 [Enterococcus faecium]|uniref:hypothetical protein n=1 Tax=Enterococcus faecium TaxID=1352 RepID=UPI0003841AA1|nr:hypothetical protein [Enterococcus faecium]HAQ1404863.1 hypothetical protein [Enterococcus faecium Ef_aus0069]AGS76149.1 hypothetical protein EFAU085_02195 [Enterococcus faecium Aus0085]MBG8391797.1 hypothetical protein [Enterococcus faecium]MBH0854262.1 hypothetical protein [Enterococcus faecium]MBH0902859.1 hypothetical protein [Enterococcus faecium]